MKVGDYVKTRGGRIAKIEYIENNIAYCDNWLWRDYADTIDFIDLENEVKLYEIIGSTANIIDLIEIGDYLNGFRVNKIERDNTNTIIQIGNSTFNVLENEEIYTPSNDNNNGYEKIEKLKSIVTKEQFENCMYKVGD